MLTHMINWDAIVTGVCDLSLQFVNCSSCVKMVLFLIRDTPHIPPYHIIKNYDDGQTLYLSKPSKISGVKYLNAMFVTNCFEASCDNC